MSGCERAAADAEIPVIYKKHNLDSASQYLAVYTAYTDQCHRLVAILISRVFNCPTHNGIRLSTSSNSLLSSSRTKIHNESKAGVKVLFVLICFKTIIVLLSKMVLCLKEHSVPLCTTFILLVPVLPLI